MGFSADFLGLIQRLMRCLRNGVAFRLGRVTRPRGFVVLNGWRDYFEPFCEEADAPLLELLNISQFPYGRRFPMAAWVARRWLRATTRPRSQFFMFDELEKLRDRRSTPRFADEEYLSTRRDLISLIWKYTAETRDAVEAWKKSVRLPAEYLALVIRRGDKVIEHPYVEVERYAQKLSETATAIRPLFVATDDVRLIPKIAEVLRDREVVWLDDKGFTGYDHAGFKALPAAERRRRTVRLFAQLEILKEARLLFGSETTNVAWLAYAQRGGEGVIWVDN